MYTDRFVWPINVDAMDLSESVATRELVHFQLLWPATLAERLTLEKFKQYHRKRKTGRYSANHQGIEKYKVSGTFHFECRSYSSLREAHRMLRIGRDRSNAAAADDELF